MPLVKLRLRSLSNNTSEAYDGYSHDDVNLSPSTSTDTSKAVPLRTNLIIPFIPLIVILVTFALVIIVASYQRMHSKNNGHLKTVSMQATQTTPSTADQTTQSGLTAADNTQSTSMGPTTGSSNSTTTIDTNGKAITIPANSSYNETTSDGSNTSNVHASNTSSSTGSGASNISSTTISVNNSP